MSTETAAWGGSGRTHLRKVPDRPTGNWHKLDTFAGSAAGKALRAAKQRRDALKKKPRRDRKRDKSRPSDKQDDIASLMRAQRQRDKPAKSVSIEKLSVLCTQGGYTCDVTYDWRETSNCVATIRHEATGRERTLDAPTMSALYDKVERYIESANAGARDPAPQDRSRRKSKKRRTKK